MNIGDAITGRVSLPRKTEGKRLSKVVFAELTIIPAEPPGKMEIMLMVEIDGA
jgi:hypothetical protein